MNSLSTTIQGDRRFFTRYNRDVLAFVVQDENIAELKSDPVIRQVCKPVWNIDTQRFAHNKKLADRDNLVDDGKRVERAEWFLMLAYAMYFLAEEQIDVAIRGYEGFCQRERLGSTGLGLGCAVPHFYGLDVDKPGVALLLATTGYEFKSLDGEPTKFAMLHIRGDAFPKWGRFRTDMSQVLREESIRQFVFAAPSPKDVLDIIEECTEDLS